MFHLSISRLHLQIVTSQLVKVSKTGHLLQNSVRHNVPIPVVCWLFLGIPLGTVVVSLHVLLSQVLPKIVLVTDITLNITFPWASKSTHIYFKTKEHAQKVHVKGFHFLNLNYPKKPRTMSMIRKSKNIICSVWHAQLSSGKITKQPMQTSNGPMNNICLMI